MSLSLPICIVSETYRLSFAAYVSDLHAFDPIVMAWEDLSAALSGAAPSPRYAHGFASESAGGRLYVHGGVDKTGEQRERGHARGSREASSWAQAQCS